MGRSPRMSSSSFRLSGAIFIVILICFSLGYYLGGENSRGTVDQAIQRISDAGQSAVSKPELQRAAIEGALRASGDQWSNFFPKSAVQILNSAINDQYTGVGLTIRKAKSGAIEVSGVDSSSPSKISGVRVGDELISINKVDITGSSLSAVLAMLRGENGSNLTLQMIRNNKKISITIKRAQVNSKSATVSKLADDVALIDIYEFNRGVSNQIRSQLSKTPHKNGMVLDLRDNPGGLLDEAVSVARLFVSGGSIVSYQKANGDEVSYSANNSGTDPAPMIVLINKSTASAAEVLAAALQDRNRAVVIGQKSYGKGSVQEISTLSDGSKLELTIAHYRTPSGRLIEGVGVSPDLIVADQNLAEKSLSILGGLSALIKSK